MKAPAKLAMKQIERRLTSLRTMAKDGNVRDGWISYMREALCMRQSALAKMTGLSQATVQQIEKREASGKVTIQTMRKIAAAMKCDFTYALFPSRSWPTI